MIIFVRRIIFQSILTTLIVLTLPLPLHAADPTLAVSFTTHQLPPWAETAWVEYQAQRAAGQTDPSVETLNQVMKQAANQGIQGFDLLASVMIQEGEEALSKGQTDKAVELGKTARQWSPDDPNSAFFLAKAQFRQHPFSPVSAIGNYFSGLAAAVGDFWFSFYLVGRLLLIVLMGLFGSFVIFLALLLIRYLPLLVHGLHEWAGSVLNPPAIWMLLLTILAIPLFMGVSPFFLLLAGLCLVWWFMTGSERLISAAFVVVMSLAVFWIPFTLSWWTADQSPELSLMAQVVRGNGEASGWESQVEEMADYDKKWPVLFSLALQKKREGNYIEALEHYLQLLKLDPDRSIFLNNIGNVYFLLKRYDDAMSSYIQSIAKNPEDAASHYNLSLVYRDLFRFNDAEKENEAARRINLPLIQSNPGTGPIDELFSKTILWNFALSDSVSNDRVARKLYQDTMGPLTLDRSMYLFFIVAAGVIAIRLALSKEHIPTQCTLCGRAICYHCQRRIMDQKTCSACWKNFKNVKRKSDLLQIKFRRRWTFRAARWISIAFPGAGHYFFEREMKGFLIQTVFVGGLFTFFYRNGFLRPPNQHGEILGNVGLFLILFIFINLYLWVYFDLSKLSYDRT